MTGGRFAGKVALITGAASGIGRAVVQRLADEGAQVLAVDVNGAGLESLVHESGEGVVGHQTDLAQRSACFAAVAVAVSTFGRLDVLGNVAGIARGEHFVDVPEAGYRQLMAINIDAPFFLCQASIPHLLATSGSIINIASNAGLMGQAYTVGYCVSKGGVIQLTRALAMEFATSPLRINAIAPGGIESALTAGYQMPTDVDFSLVRPYVGLRGMGQPADIANLFAFVASDEGANLHGAILCSDRGLTAG